jgi:hypothetical protein
MELRKLGSPRACEVLIQYIALSPITHENNCRGAINCGNVAVHGG